MDTNTQTRQTIVRLLSSMGSAKEISQYLRRFSQLDAKRFAVVKVGGAVLRDDLENLVSSLAFLQQVGLTPIVIHGAGPQLDTEMTAAGIENPQAQNPFTRSVTKNSENDSIKKERKGKCGDGYELLSNWGV